MPDVLSMGVIEWGRLGVLAFFAIAFLQSGIDKVFDWDGNLGWLTGHFGSSPFKGMVPLLLGAITFFECLAGGAALMGLILMLTGSGTVLAEWAMGLTLLTLLMLFFGQRIAKDYAGAAVIAAYFVVALAGVLLFAPLAS